MPQTQDHGLLCSSSRLKKDDFALATANLLTDTLKHLYSAG